MKKRPGPSVWREIPARKYNEDGARQDLTAQVHGYCFTASISLVDFNGTTYFLEDKHASKHLSV